MDIFGFYSDNLFLFYKRKAADSFCSPRAQKAPTSSAYIILLLYFSYPYRFFQQSFGLLHVL